MSRLRLFLLILTCVIGVSIASAQEQTYVVRAGDTVNAIAQIYGVTPQTILTRNGLANLGSLVVGQVLIIPQTSIVVTPTPVPVVPTTYIIQAGDTLQKIAPRFGTTWRALAAYNAIVNPNLIYRGLTLRIPPAGYMPPTNPGQGGGGVVTPAAPPIVGNHYVVQYGDTMIRIAARLGRNAWAIAQANGIYNLNMIYAGQVLRIP